MEPTLVVIGISLRSAKLAVRERFLLDTSQRLAALTALVRSDGIDEVIVLSNCNRTEFIVWTQNASEAANSVLRYLTRAQHLKLMEWSSFYRLVGDAAVTHVLRVTCGVEGTLLGESEATNSMLGAWQQAQRFNTTGRFLDALMSEAFSVAGRVRQEAGGNGLNVAEAVVRVCAQKLGELEQRRILVMGAGQMALALARELHRAGAGEITVLNRSWEHAQLLARQCKVRAAHAENLWEQVLHADVVISAAAGRVLMTREELSLVMPERRNKHLLILDIAVPRTIDPTVNSLEGITAIDLDSLNEAMEQCESRRQMQRVAERLIAEEAVGFHGRMLCEGIVPTISAMREMLGSICGQELDQLREQFGPFTEDQELALEALSAHITQRIAATLSRQLKEMPGQPELTSAIQQLFQLEVGTSTAESSLRFKS